jgi:geranylgeranyl diphosphate synthase, type II
MTALRLIPPDPADRPSRPAGEFVPPTPQQRAELRRQIDQWVAAQRDLHLGELDTLRQRAQQLCLRQSWPDAWRDWVAVHIGNAVMRSALARVPFDRRLLMLPKCLRDAPVCTAKIDGVGLLCARCGRCPICELEAEAQRLGYAVLVAEGSAVVMAILERRQIEAVIGISCLGVLERAFAYLEAAGIPGMGIPLLQNDCADTCLDIDWAYAALHLGAPSAPEEQAGDPERQRVRAIFSEGGLARIMGAPQTPAEVLAHRWMLQGGKRWRPILAASLCLAAPNARHDPLLDSVLVAIECFHKASLIHDDIEDHDADRYGMPTLHKQVGIPEALNVGDLLIGEGYRLLAEAPADAATRASLLRVAAEGHRQLCLGQGLELSWRSARRPLYAREVLEIMRLKTAPAFAVALKLGALAAGLGEASFPMIEKYADALGIAYQVRDDAEDAARDVGENPSAVLALAWENAQGPDRDLLAQAWCGQKVSALDALLARLDALGQAHALVQQWKHAALEATDHNASPEVRAVLRRIIIRVFDKPELEGWCRDVAAGYASSRPAGA